MIYAQNYSSLGEDEGPASTSGVSPLVSAAVLPNLASCGKGLLVESDLKAPPF